MEPSDQDSRRRNAGPLVAINGDDACRATSRYGYQASPGAIPGKWSASMKSGTTGVSMQACAVAGPPVLGGGDQKTSG